MANSRLLQTACAVALLAAAPAFAQQTGPQSGLTGPNGAPNPVAAQPGGASTAQGKSTTGSTSMAPANDGANTTSMAPANNAGSNPSATADSSTAASSHSTHRSAMAHGSGAMHGRSDTSQDAAVDKLNDQSYQSAQQGQAFNATTSDSGSGMSKGMTMPGGAAGSSSSKP